MLLKCCVRYLNPALHQWGRTGWRMMIHCQQQNWRFAEKIACLDSKSLYELLTRGVTSGVKRGAVPDHSGAPKSTNNFASTFISAVHLLPKDLMLKYGGAKNLFLVPGAIYPRYALILTMCFDKDMINLIYEKKWIVFQAKNCPNFQLDPTSLNRLFEIFLLSRHHSLPGEDLHWSTSVECRSSSTDCSFEHVKGKVWRY